MRSNIKVLFLPVWYPNKFNKIGGCFVRQHAFSLRGAVTLGIYHICAHPRLGSICRFEESIEDDLLVYRIYYYSFTQRFLKPLNLFLYGLAGVLGYFKTIKKFGKPDINHVHVLTRVGVFALIAKFLHKTPYVISEHWSRYLPERNTYRGFLRKVVTRLVVQESNGIAAVSENLKSAILKKSLYHKHFITIPNTINFSFFKPTDQGIKISFHFLHVSGLTNSIKNVTGILDACSLLLKKGFLFKLHIVGNDDSIDSLIEYSIQLNLQRNVFFMGELTGAYLVNQYQQADAFILFSYFENQPCVLIEAFSCGVPVIATRAGGIPEIVGEANGILVNTGNIQMLANAMEDFITQKKRFDKERIRSEAESLYSYRSVANQIISFYITALSKSSQNSF